MHLFNICLTHVHARARTRV